MSTTTIYIGLFHVKPGSAESPLSEGAQGAYGNVVSYASSPEEFYRSVSSHLESIGMCTEGAEDVDTIDAFRTSGKLSEYLEFLVRRVEEGEAYAYHTFYNYIDDDITNVRD